MRTAWNPERHHANPTVADTAIPPAGFLRTASSLIDPAADRLDVELVVHLPVPREEP